MKSLLNTYSTNRLNVLLSLCAALAFSLALTTEPASITTDIFKDAVVTGSGTVTYQANTDVTGVLSFDKSQDYWIDLNALQGDLEASNRSIFMWIKSETNVTSSDQVLFGMNEGGTSTKTVANFLIDNSGENLEIYDGGSFQSASYDLGDGRWHYVGYTYDHNTTETVVYVDGIENDRYNNSQPALIDTRYSLGQEFDGTTASNFYNGDMAEISVWDEVLTGIDIRLAMKARINNGHPKYSNLVGYYSVFGNTGDDTSVLTDHSGKDNHGIMQNSFALDFTNVQSVAGFNAIDWYENLSWKKDGTEVSTANEFTTTVAVGNYEFIATRDFIESTDVWTMTTHSNAVTVDDIPSEILCEDDPVIRSVPDNLVTYLDFEEGEDNYIEVNSLVDDLRDQSRSVFMWLNKESNIGSGDFNEVLVFQNTDIDQLSRFYLRSTEKLALWDGINDRLNSSTELDNGTWYFVGYTYDHTSGETKLYVNGMAEDSGILDMPLGEGWFGSLGMKYNDNGPEDHLDGQLAEISFWNKVLSESEIADLMNAAPDPVATNLVANFGTLTSIADNQLRDQSGNGHNGLVSHSTIIVNDAEAAIPGYDASRHATFLWTKDNVSFSTESSVILDIIDGTFDYTIAYGTPFFPKTEEFSISYTDLLPAQPTDVTASTQASGVFEVEDIPEATYQWFEKKDFLIRKVNGDEDFPGLNRPNIQFNSIASEGENHIYVGTTNGLLVSEDAGETWSLKRRGSPSSFGLNEVRDLAVEGDIVFVTGKLGVAVSLDKGKTWRTTLNKESGLATGDVGEVVDGMSHCYIDQGILYATSRQGRFVKSTDDGRNWESLSTLGGLFGNNSIYVDGDVQISAINNVTNGPGVFIPGKVLVVPGAGQERVVRDAEDFGLTNTDPCTDALKIGDRYLVGTNKGLFSSTDLDNWALVSEIGSSYINQLLVESNIAYAYSGSRVYMSEDNGLTWSLLKSVSGTRFDITGDKIFTSQYQTLIITADREKLSDDTDVSAVNSIQGATTRQLSINNLSLEKDQTEYYVEVTTATCEKSSDLAVLTVTDGIVDVIPPDDPIITGISEDTGISDSDGITSDQNILIMGTAEPNSTIEVSTQFGPLRNTTTDANGDWVLDVQDITLAQVVTNITAIAVDQAGNRSAMSNVFVLTPDFTAPADPVITGISDDTGISDSDGITSDQNILIMGTAEANATVEVSSQFGPLRSTTTDANGDWVLDVQDIALVQVVTHLTAEAVDQAGNRSGVSNTFTMTPDFTAPAKPVITGISDDTGTSDSDGITSDQNILIMGTAEANATVEVSSQFGPLRSTTTDANGDWVLDVQDITLVQVVTNLRAEAVDEAGNRSEVSDIFVLTPDFIAPDKPVITSISDDTGSSHSDGITSDKNIIISGTAEANAAVEVSTQFGALRSTTADANGDWVLDITDITLIEFTVNLTAEAVDEAGNRSATSDAFILTPDFTSPGGTIAVESSSPAGYTISALFDEDVTGLGLGGITVTGGTASSLVQNNASSYSFFVSLSGSTVDIQVDVAAAQDIAGNDNTASNQLTLGLPPNATGEGFTNLSEPAKTEMITVYPNPASRVLTIDLSELRATGVDIQLYNAAGIPVFTQQGFRQKVLRLDVSSYKSGMYIVQLYDGQEVIRKKVMVKK